MYMFYCPRCERFEENLDNVFKSEFDKRINNVRTDYVNKYGNTINYFKCPVCGCLEAGSSLAETDCQVECFKNIIDYRYECLKSNDIVIGGIAICK